MKKLKELNSVVHQIDMLEQKFNKEGISHVIAKFSGSPSVNLFVGLNKKDNHPLYNVRADQEVPILKLFRIRTVYYLKKIGIIDSGYLPTEDGYTMNDVIANRGYIYWAGTGKNDIPILLEKDSDERWWIASKHSIDISQGESIVKDYFGIEILSITNQLEEIQDYLYKERFIPYKSIYYHAEKINGFKEIIG